MVSDMQSYRSCSIIPLSAESASEPLVRTRFVTRVTVACLIGLTYLACPQHLPVAAAGVAETIADVQPRMVKIFGAGGIKNLYAYSTGFLVTGQGHIVTVWSHVLDGDTVSVVLNDGRKYEARVLGAEPQLDLAVLKIDDAEIEQLPHFDLSIKPERFGAGQRVLAFSNMFKVAAGDEPMSVLHGVIAARTRLVTRRGAFETPYQGSVYVVDCISNNPGAGGGVIVTYDGQLVGMIGKELRNAETNTWLNYAIPIDELREPAQQIIEDRYERREALSESETNPRNYNSLDLGIVMVPDVLVRTPAYVDSVIPESVADQIGLRSNDLVMFVNDQLIQSVSELQDELGRQQAGDTLRVVVRRRDQLETFEILMPRKTSAKPVNR